MGVSGIDTESTARALFSTLQTSRYLSYSNGSTKALLAEANSVSTKSELFQILNSGAPSDSTTQRSGLTFDSINILYVLSRTTGQEELCNPVDSTSPTATELQGAAHKF